ncbi:MAG: hypothetical protein R3Y57_01995 [Erysipelotrichaceae bacterium]
MFILSVCGWCMEVMLTYIKEKKFVNRGFLIGPYCPVYGVGAVILIVLVAGILGYHGNMVITFILGVIICGGLEYFASWYMEKRFHARWWDYSDKPCNINGRVWAGYLFLFGLATLIIVHYIAPLFFIVLDKLTVQMIEICACLISIIMITDFIISHMLMGIVKTEIDKHDTDNTEEISEKIHALLINQSLLIRRIHEAYPRFKVRPTRLLRLLKESKKELRLIENQLKKEYQNIKNKEITHEITYLKQRRALLNEKIQKIRHKIRQI